MRLSVVLVTLLMSGCTVSNIKHQLLEDFTDSDIRRNIASCNQIKNTCNASRQNNPTSFRYYSEWENDDGSIGYSCSAN
jgi:hypothetical protein